MDLRDISLMGKIGVFLLLFIICISVISVFIDELTEVEEDLGLPSHSGDYQNLKFALGFIIVLCMAGAVLYLLRSSKKKRKEDRDGN